MSLKYSENCFFMPNPPKRSQSHQLPPSTAGRSSNARVSFRDKALSTKTSVEAPCGVFGDSGHEKWLSYDTWEI